MNITLTILIIPALLIILLPIVLPIALPIIERYDEGKRQQTVERADSYQRAIAEWEKELKNGTF